MSIPSVLAAANTAASSVLNDEVKGYITNGFSSLTATVSDVLAISVPAAVGIIALTGGINYALRKIKGVIYQAA